MDNQSISTRKCLPIYVRKFICQLYLTIKVKVAIVAVGILCEDCPLCNSPWTTWTRDDRRHCRMRSFFILNSGSCVRVMPTKFRWRIRTNKVKYDEAPAHHHGSTSFPSQHDAWLDAMSVEKECEAYLCVSHAMCRRVPLRHMQWGVGWRCLPITHT